MLSIIIPAVNEENYIGAILKSIKAQTFQDCEIIVADAGSSDRTVQIAKEFGCRVTSGGSPARGRNQGAEAALGEIFLFLDADNHLPDRDFLEKAVRQFREKKLAVASFPIYPADNPIDKSIYFIYNVWVDITQKFLPHATNSIMVTRDVHFQIGGFDEEIKLAEDHDYARRAACRGRFGFIKGSPIFTSSRRFERDGRLLTYLKYLLAGIYIMLAGPIKSDIFNYHLGGFFKKEKGGIIKKHD